MENRKLIVFTVTNDLSYDQRMQRHASVLTLAGFEVLLVGRKRKLSIPLPNQIFKQKRLNCITKKGKWFYLEFNVRLFFYLLSIKADVFAAIDLDTLLPNTLAAKIKGKKLVFDAHEYFTEVPELENRFVTKALWQQIANACVPIANRCYTVGPVLADLFSKQYQQKFHTIMNVPPLIDLQRTTNRIEPRIIFYQGALNEGRGLEQLINAMTQVDAQLWIAGEGDLSMELRTQVIDKQLQNKVSFLGFVEPKDLPALTLKAYIGCNILEPKGLSYQYSLANKFFDYMHAEIPQICANFLDYQQINAIYPIALLVDCNEDSLIKSINKLLNNNELYQSLKNNCNKAAQAYNLQSESAKLTEIYKSIF